VHAQAKSIDPYGKIAIMNADLLERIEAYLDGRIDRETLEQSATAAGATDLDREIEWLRDSRTAIEAAGLREQLRHTLPATAAPTVRRLRPSRTLLAIAASLLVLVVAALWWLNQPATPALYAEYEYIDPGLPVLMSQSEDYELYDALTYYGEGNYAVAAEKLRGLTGSPADSDTLRFYLGASLLYQGRPEAAQTEFERILAAPDAEFKPRAQWLSVLAALRREDYATARRRLTPILSTPGHPFAEAARNLAAEWD
jgi:hypothetical protein